MAKRRHGKDEWPEEPAGPEAEAEAPQEAPDQEAAAGAEESLDAVKAERDDLLGRLQRVSADYINYQRRARRDVEAAHDYANAELIRDILAVLDDMERALEAGATNHAGDDPLLAGMRLVYDKALEVLGRYGLTPIEAEGQPFDPTRHEAMMQQPSDAHEPQTVLSQLQRGYELKGRVLRPARVVVSAPPAETPEADQPQDESE